MHILLFGGSFDPVHNAHLEIARAVVSHSIADQVWLVPCSHHPFGKAMSSARDRQNMLELAILELNDTRILVNSYELDQSKVSFTFETISQFAATRPEHTFSWLIGSDQLPSFSRWKNWQQLIKNYTVYVYPRQDFDFEQLQDGMIALKQLPLVTLSSTFIRESIQNNKNIGSYIPKPVADYIEEHSLYVK